MEEKAHLENRISELMDYMKPFEDEIKRLWIIEKKYNDLLGDYKIFKLENEHLTNLLNKKLIKQFETSKS